jgi:hypothetical protein
VRRAYLPIALVIAIFALDYATYQRVLTMKWPFVQWTMYQRKGSTEPVVQYRRFVAYRADGTRVAVDLGDAFGFLRGAYQLDRGLDKTRTGFLELCLDALRRKQSKRIVGLAHEKRSWRFEEQPYAEHLEEAPGDSFRVVLIDAPPAELRRPADGNLLVNGTFVKLKLRSGWPKDWTIDGHWLGTGRAKGMKDRALLLAAGPAPQSATQTVIAPPGTRALRLTALVRAEGPGAAIELGLGSSPNTARAEAPADGSWHAIEVSVPLPEGAAAGEAHVVLRTSGAADVYYADVALHPSGG